MVLAEITAICEYLEELHPYPPLIGATPQRARRDPHVDAAHRPQHRRADGQRLPLLARAGRCSRTACAACPKAADGLKAIAQDKLAWLDGQMAERPWIVGERFTLADILLFCFLDFGARSASRSTPATRRIAGWFERVDARPSAAASAAS